ncbi:MAG: hypothetical protein KDE29_19295, partial [Anaerolineales bacterium]|nr:hypothetical protein [Anaerolineales bacterium]
PIAANLAAHTDPGDLAADLADLCAALANLALQIEIVAQYGLAARFTPGYSAALPGSTTPITLTVSNNGSSPTTYSVDLTLPGGPTSFNTTLQPGESADFVYPLTPAGIGLTTLEATITALDAAPVLLQTTVRAGLNTVDRFIQLTAVTPDPAFVETGSSSTTINIAVNNVANIQRAATARTTILAPGGAISHTSDLPLTLFTGPPRTYPLGSVDTTNWAAGVYTVAVQLLDSNSTLIPDGSGYGYLRVGQALGIRHDLNTTLVPPGTFTVTTYITSEILVDTIVNGDAPLGFANATPGEVITFTEPLSDTGIQPTLMFGPAISET